MSSRHAPGNVTGLPLRQGLSRKKSVLIAALMIAVVAAAMIMTPTLCSAGSFTAPQQVTDVPGGANLDEIAQAVDQNGFSHIVWTGGDDYYQVWYADNTQGAWSVTQLTSERDHYGPSIVVDSNGKTHLAWYGDDSSGIYQIYYATNASGEWVTNQVTSSLVNYQGSPTLAIDGDDNLHLAWEGPADPATGGPTQVWYTQDPSGAHNQKTTDSAEDVWSYDLTLDSAGHDHIAWCNSSSHQIFATDNTSGSWVTGQVTSASGNYWPKIAIDAQGFSHVAWFTNVYGVWISNVWYADNVGGSWGTPIQLTFSSSFEDRYQANQIALDSNGVCYIAVNENRAGYSGWLFSRTSDGWTSTLVTENGYITSMVLGPDGNPQMVWDQGSGGGEEQVWYGRKTAEGIAATQITSSPFRQYMSTLAVDRFGEPLVVWNGHVAEYVEQVWFTTMPSNPVVTGVSPGTGVNDQSAIPVTVQGDVLKSGATLTLTGPSTIGPVPTTGSGTALSATLDLKGKAAGIYSATVTNPDGLSGTLPAAFTIDCAMPVINTAAVSNITPTTASSGGNVTDDGGDPETVRGVCWSTSADPTTADDHTEDGTGTGAFTSSITGLSINTSYHVRAYATNSVGTSYGADVVFNTNLPTVTTAAPSNITPTTSDSGGEVTDEGGAGVTARGVCWSTSADPTTSDDHTEDGTGTGTFTSSITGLSPGTSYHVRAYATNSVGTSYGADVVFTTLNPLPAITSIDPSSKNAGDPGFTLTVNGTDFVPGSVVRWNGAGRTTTYVSPTKLTAAVPASDIASAGTASVTVFNPAPGGGTSNAKTFTVNTPPSPVTTTWYQAEGTNAWGFNTYISITNPNNSAVTARLTYMDPNPQSGAGVVFNRTVPLPPLSQTTVSSQPDIGNVDFSTKVECIEGKQIAVDRTMFWTGEGAPSPEGHSSIGTTTPSETWYLPEGSSNWGFETWTAVLNPNNTEAKVTITYMTEDQGSKVLNKVVPPNSRATYSMASDIGAADASIKVTSDLPVIAERSMYRNNRREGSCSIGATSPAADFFLAEGACGYDAGFTTYVLVQNPNDSDVQVTLTYQTPSGPKPQPPFTMGANSRKTVRVNDALPPDTDVSAAVHGSKPVIAERAVYWGAGTPLGEAMHASIGLDSAHMSFYLPDGQTSGGFETWTLIANPNPGSVTVRITYLPQGGGTPVSFTDEIPAGTRSTYNMAQKMGDNARASIMVESLDGARPVIVERAMYWNSRGAGTDTIGGFSD